MKYFIFPIYVVDQENAEIQKHCIESFMEHTPFSEDIRIMVVDNGSHYGLKDIATFAQIYMRFPKPLGFAKAVNIAWDTIERLGDAEIIGVLNNDLVFLPDWLDGLLENLDEKTMAVAPSDYEMDGISDHIWSSCFFQRADIRRKMGFFDDKELPYRYHDQDYWMRGKKLGLQFKRVGKNQVLHRESTTYRKMKQDDPRIAESELKEKEIMMKRWGVDMAQHYDPNLST